MKQVTADTNRVIAILKHQIGELILTNAILQAKIEELENQIEQKQYNKDKQAQ